MPAGRRTERTERRRELARRLVDALEDLMADGTTLAELPISDLAGAALVSRSTFYVYFADRRELAVALTDAMTERLVLDLGQEWQPGAIDVDGVRRLIHAGLTFARRHHHLHRAIVETAALDREFYLDFAKRADTVTDLLTLAVTTAREENGLPTGNDRQLAAALLWMCESISYAELGRADDEALQRWEDALVTICWGAVTSDAGVPAASGRRRRS